ncbi:pectate lyase [Cellvibrio japonicus]|uniref:Pectate lyase, putative, pel10C n=1 Tax=Cellvibrio japonicus (strain Ueda107) TaxID=498211 RepID=B3PI45_CELJU|nr:pectate lyase [Cellvibrio japonicus]ACE84681.1 pectate lyase, putative, pel10C [Cellvibrio japonicus Ueda107]QEI11094.1 pectate lyase [Cellvibrio japonicus]QEI14668.1 pectate lyase [Cellvibrio japonicus]QEI18248.1 pectate lyase [Cellvibrio japonicus]
MRTILKYSLAVIALCQLPLSFAADQSATANSTQAALEAQWQAYINHSAALRKADWEVVKKEAKRRGLKEPLLPGYTKEFGFETNQPLEWFKSDEGKAIMEAILSLQTPSGGWSKRTDMTKKRKPGMAFGTEKNYIPTFDNDATTMQLTLLAKAFAATGNKVYSDAFARGLELIFTAQYPNGGWPQNYPLVGGYHNYITYNDELMVNIMFLLRDVAKGEGNYAFASAEQRKRAQQSLDRAIECALNTQVMIGNKLTVWGAQHDPITLMPAKARAYEMASLTSTESVWMVEFFMSLDNPSPAIIESVHSAIAWYQATKMTGKTWTRGDKALTDDPNAPPLWSRFYELGTDKPIFGDRDDSIHYDIGEVSKERREGYAWFSTAPNKILKHYEKWAKKYPRPS